MLNPMQTALLSALLLLVAALAMACGEDGTSAESDTVEDASEVADAPGDSPSDSDEQDLVDANEDVAEDMNDSHPEPTVPEPSGPCPEFESGVLDFAPAGKSPRQARVWLGDNPTSADGPLIFYWHGTGSSPMEATYGLVDYLDQVTEAGGMVVAPIADPASETFPWFLTDGAGPDDDMVLADEILGCAVDAVGIDTHRIHSIGMSAGGLQTTQMAYLRSDYVASVVTYSGGIIPVFGPPSLQNRDNQFSALIFHGGPNDNVVVSFQQASEFFWQDLEQTGRFGVICNHNGGHVIPTDGRLTVDDFFDAHPWGTVPSPWENQLPLGVLPSYCQLNP